MNPLHILLYFTIGSFVMLFDFIINGDKFLAFKNYKTITKIVYFLFCLIFDIVLWPIIILSTVSKYIVVIVFFVIIKIFES
jgi:hypothetical protein